MCNGLQAADTQLIALLQCLIQMILEIPMPLRLFQSSSYIVPLGSQGSPEEI